MKLELTRVGLLVELANHYTIRALVGMHLIADTQRCSQLSTCVEMLSYIHKNTYKELAKSSLPYQELNDLQLYYFRYTIFTNPSARAPLDLGVVAIRLPFQ